MEKITKCLNEWNAIVEALGTGKQSILIRKSGTNLSGFLLYPTISYASNENYLELFKPEFNEFVLKNTLPQEEGNKKIVKYYAEVVKTFEYPYSHIGALNKYHIWTNENVKSYLRNKRANVWLLRVYELKEPVMTGRTDAIVYANVLDQISLEGMKPVIPDNEFAKIKAILNK